MRALIKEEDSFEIPLTPLIDVVFLLLVFFLVATNFTRKEYDQRVELPPTGSGKISEYVQQNLVLNIHKDGTVIVNGRVIEDSSLPAVLDDWKENSPGNRVIIRSDGKVTYNRVMELMGLCRETGIEQVDLPVVKKK